MSKIGMGAKMEKESLSPRLAHLGIERTRDDVRPDDSPSQMNGQHDHPHQPDAR